MNKQEILKRMEVLMSRTHLRPEAQVNTFRKFQAALKLEERLEDEALIHIVNALGAQIKNSLRFHKSNGNPKAPVLDPSFMEDFENQHDLKSKLSEMPSEWTVIQITGDLSVPHIVGMTKEDRKADPPLIISRITCGQAVKDIPPYLVRVPPPENLATGPSLIDRIREFMQARREYYSNPNRKGEHLRVFNDSDAGLALCLKEAESHWLQEWHCLLRGRLLDEFVEKEIRKQISELWLSSGKSSSNEKKALDILYQVVVNTDHMKQKSMTRCIKYAFGKGIESETVAIWLDKIAALGKKYAKEMKNRHPVILIVDQNLELFPWEMTLSLSGQPVSRVISLHFLYALFKYHQPHIRNGFRMLPVSSCYCLLNPDSTLSNCEKRIGEYLKTALPWIKVIAGSVPDGDKLMKTLHEYSIFLYCGHGSGSQFHQRGELHKTVVDSLVMLFGCSSNLPQGRGGRTPYQNDTYVYLSNGCPAITGALYEILSAEADHVCIKMLSSLLPTITPEGIKDPIQPDLLQALLLGKSSGERFWTKCAFVARGLPIKITYEKTKLGCESREG